MKIVKKTIAEFKVEYIQVLDEKGNVDKELMPKLSDKQIKEMYEKMVLVRTFDEKALNMQRQGRIGSYLQVKGQEASQVGSVYALNKDDWMFPMYRSSGALIARNHPIDLLFLYWGGDERGLQSPKGINNFPISIPVGTQTAHAAGAGWAAAIKGEKKVSLGFLGDGATSKSEFHTGLNFAGVFGAHTVFVCENNQFAISTPRERQTHAETIAQKGIAYGIRCLQVDGNDVFAMYKATKEAMSYALKGQPTFIEADTYRMEHHTTSDDWKKYRSTKEVKEWEKKDPILRLRKYMESKRIWNTSKEEKLRKEIAAVVKTASKKYLAIKPPAREEMFKYMFAKGGK